MGKEKTSLVKLLLTFAKIGAVTFGGGYAMLPILQREIVEKNNWCTEDDILDYFAIGQCTPGIIAVNTATFIGQKTRGIIGGIAATLGLVFPSLVIISIIYNLLSNFQDNIYVQRALSGIQCAVCALIVMSVVKLSKKSIVDIPTAVIAAVVLILIAFFKVSPVFMILLSGISGICLKSIKEKGAEA